MPEASYDVIYGPGNQLIAQVAGAVSSTQMAAQVCRLIRFRAYAGNTGKFVIGTASGVTLTTGWELSAGEDTGWIPCTNRNLFWRITTGAGDNAACWMVL